MCSAQQTLLDKKLSPFYLTLTARCSKTKLNRKLSIKKVFLNYCKHNSLALFDFASPSPDDVILHRRLGASRPAIKTNNLANDKLSQRFQKLTIEIDGPAVKSLDRLSEKPVEKVKSGYLTSRSQTPTRSQTPSRGQSPSSRNTSRINSPVHDLRDSKCSKVINAKSSMDAEMAFAEYNKRTEEGGKPLINLVVIGHVDAGKSTLMGHLLFLLGCVSKKQIHRYETDSKKMGKASFMYAWVLDETDEERTRGITMDVAQSRFETPNRLVTLLDAPGHKDFIPNMITGAAQADVAILVVDSTKGEFETGFDGGGQTREHTLLVRSLGVSQLAVAVNKLDNVGWSCERYSDIVNQLTTFLKQVGFKEQDITFVPCSGLTGDNLVERSKTSPLTSWYDGPCLMEVIDSFKPPERPLTKPFRMSINDIFKGLTSGLYVSGRVEAGAVQVGQKLVIQPAGEQCVVKAINNGDEAVDRAFVGDHITLVLSGCDVNHVSIGSLVCDANDYSPVTSRFEARVVLFNNVEVPITKGFPVVVHFQNMSEQATIRRLICQLQKNSDQVIKKKPRCLFKNNHAIISLELSRTVAVELYKNYKDLGRFTIRSGGVTIAGGIVTKVIGGGD